MMMINYDSDEDNDVDEDDDDNGYEKSEERFITIKYKKLITLISHSFICK